MVRVCAVGLLLALVCGCAQPQHGDGSAGSSPPPDSGTTAPPGIDFFKELAIVDATVVLDPRSSNLAGGPWSFRWFVERMTPSGQRPGDLVERWLRTLRETTVEGVAVGDRAGVEDLLAAWPRTREGALDLAQAPFRLLAIVNRLDLDTSSNGEGRFVFGYVDFATRKPDRLTVALEYRLPPLGTPDDRREWARRWHELSARPFGEPYNAALEAITRAFALPDTLSQLRTNEARFGPNWELRQWVLDKDARGAFLRPVLTPRTPPQSLNGSARLAQFLQSNAAAILAGDNKVLTRDLLGGAASETEAWSFRSHPEIGQDVRHAFAVQTCNGCHSGETASARGFFHVDPFRAIAGDGRDRLSDFLKESQLPQRAENLKSLLAGGPRVEIRFPPLPPRPASPRYDLMLVPAGDDSAAAALDAKGRVLGNSSKGPWIYDGGLHYLVAGGSRDMTATGFNARGDVVGYEGAGKDRRAFAIVGGRIVRPGTLGGQLSLATAIDDSGHVAGDSTTGAGDYHGFLWVDGALRDLGTLGGNDTMIGGMSPAGLVTGVSQAADGTRHAFLFDGRALRDLGALGGDFAFGQAVNDRGQVAGMSEMVPGDRKIHAFFWDGAAMHDLGALPGLPWTSAPGLNNAGVVAGNVYNKPDDGSPDYDTYAYVYRDGLMTNLNDLMPQSPGVVLRTTLGINDAGQILCSDGQVGAASARAYLLTPR